MKKNTFVAEIVIIIFGIILAVFGTTYTTSSEGCLCLPPPAVCPCATYPNFAHGMVTTTVPDYTFNAFGLILAFLVLTSPWSPLLLLRSNQRSFEPREVEEKLDKWV